MYFLNCINNLLPAWFKTQYRFNTGIFLAKFVQENVCEMRVSPYSKFKLVFKARYFEE